MIWCDVYSTHKRRWSSPMIHTLMWCVPNWATVELRSASHAQILVNPHTQNTTISSLTLHSNVVCGGRYSVAIVVVVITVVGCFFLCVLKQLGKVFFTKLSEKRERPKIHIDKKLPWSGSFHYIESQLLYAMELMLRKVFTPLIFFLNEKTLFPSELLYSVDRRTFEAELYHSKTDRHTENAITPRMFHSWWETKYNSFHDPFINYSRL